jgi:DhnA family fructose-bisphosphate aldolase class Ia
MTAQLGLGAGALARIRETRATDPGAIARAAARRPRRPVLHPDGRLLIVAADHPARGVTGVGDRPAVMADRSSLLERLLTCLSHPRVDGVLATADIIEDLLLLGALDGRLAIGSMNRGGIAGSVFEMDDRITGYDAGSVAGMHLDGGKLLCRIDPGDPATVATLETVGAAVTALAGSGLMAMLEPFWSHRDSSGTVVSDLTAAAVARSIQVVTALGGTSAHTWLKLPLVAEMERVVAATTLPAVILGGDRPGSTAERVDSWGRALTIPGVRGLVVGRALLYPPDDDVAGAVAAAAALLPSPGQAPPGASW